MKRSYVSVLLLTAALNVMATDDFVMPDNIKQLTPAGVEVSAIANKSLSMNKKRVVKTDNNLIFFAASTAESGEELWVSDCTCEGTKMVKDVCLGPDGSNPSNLTVVGNKVYFAATTQEFGEELWVSDGTEEGTKMVADIFPNEMSSSPFGITKIGDKVLFFATDDDSDFSPIIDPETSEQWLWVSDGTEEGTLRIGDTPTRQTSFDSPHGHIVVLDKPEGPIGLFIGYTIETGETLWVTDGTRAGTKIVKDINPKPSDDGVFMTSAANIDWMTNVNNKVIVFRAETVKEVTGTVDIGSEIWMSDGTPEGTNWIGVDFFSGETDSKPNAAQFACTRSFGDKLYFRGNDGIHNVEPCLLDISKPIEAGINPRCIADINHWEGNMYQTSWPDNFYEFGEYIYCIANGGFFFGDAPETASGYSLWRMKPNPEDPNGMYTYEYHKEWAGYEWLPGGAGGGNSDSSDWFTTVNNQLFYVAQDAKENMELTTLGGDNYGHIKIVDLPGNGKVCHLINVQENLVFASETNKAIYYMTVGGAVGMEKEVVNKNIIKFYPNPATDFIYIDSEAMITNVRLVTVQGVLVKEQKNDQPMSVSDLQSGIYILSVSDANGNVCNRQVIIN